MTVAHIISIVLASIALIFGALSLVYQFITVREYKRKRDEVLKDYRQYLSRIHNDENCELIHTEMLDCPTNVDAKTRMYYLNARGDLYCTEFKKSKYTDSAVLSCNNCDYFCGMCTYDIEEKDVDD